MRRSLRAAALSLPYVLLLAACRGATIEADVVLEHATVVDTRTGALLRDHSLAVRDGEIVSVAPFGRVTFAPAATRIDASGLYAVPGLWDAHAHVLQEELDVTTQQLVPLLLAQGITHARDMSSSLDARRAFRAWARGDSVTTPEVLSPGPALWAFRLPYGDKRRQLIATTDAELEAALDSLARDSVDFVKVYSGFSAGALARLAALASARGLVLAGHVQDGATLEDHARAGFRTVEHADFPMFAECGVDPDPFFERVIAARYGGSAETVPGVYVAFGAALDRARCAQVLARAGELGLAFTPTLAATYVTPEDLAGLDTLAIPAFMRDECARYRREFARSPTSEWSAFQAVGFELTRLARDAGMPILAGTDGPVFCSVPGANLALELSLLRRAGLSPLEVLQAATLVPSQVLAPSRRLGALEVGHEAHVTLLPGNPLADVRAYAAPAGVYTRGRWLGRAALDSLRTEARAFDASRVAARPFVSRRD